MLYTMGNIIMQHCSYHTVSNYVKIVVRWLSEIIVTGWIYKNTKCCMGVPPDVLNNISLGAPLKILAHSWINKTAAIYSLLLKHCTHKLKKKQFVMSLSWEVNISAEDCYYIFCMLAEKQNGGTISTHYN